MAIVYLSPVSWNSIAQRPHFFADFLAKNNKAKVIWVDPLPSRFPKIDDIRTKLIGVEADSISKMENIIVIRARNVIPIEPLNKLYKVINVYSLNKLIQRIKDEVGSQYCSLVIGKPSAFSLKLMKAINFKYVIADVMDDYPQFFSGLAQVSVNKLLKDILGKADIALFSSSGLINKYSSLAASSLLIKNACSHDFLSQLQENSSDVNTQYLKKEVITYGYIGSIAKWFDWDFIFRLSSEKPNSLIRIIGPNYSKLINLPKNVVLEPAIHHSQIPKIVKSFDYGLIPFKINELTDSVDPVKYYEYTAAKVPVISTSFGEMAQRIDSGFAVTLEQHLNNKHPIIESPIFWEDRFKLIDREVLYAQ
ncbi:hypothetical protein [Atlantibacter sp.]|uniref:hypothetical protein n=1 Tax=Atlantibacter sp. TaxID=1903473 RepID=UPI0028AB223A|nr:hypothetical protein [Atlantibacter sp.]